MEMFNGMFGKVQSGKCRLSVNGEIAVHTSTGYKTYNLETGRFTNCDNFVFNIGDEMFFVIPTNKVKPGDIILVAGTPRCVIAKDKKTIQVINYENSTVETILPEHHVFMGNTYFYGKIVSMFGTNITGTKGGMGKIMKYLMMAEMMKGVSGGAGFNPFGNTDADGNTASTTGGFNMSAMMPLMLMNGGMGDMFSGMFDFEDDDDYDDSYDDDDEPEEEVIVRKKKTTAKKPPKKPAKVVEVEAAADEEEGS